MSGKRYITWAEKNGFMPNYNNPVTKDRTCQPERYHKSNFPVALCTACGRAFETRQSNGKGNKNNKILKPRYMPGGFPTLDCERSLCGFDKCYNEPS